MRVYFFLRSALWVLLSSLCFLPVAIPQSQNTDPFQQGLLALKQNRLDQALNQLTIAESARPLDARVRNFRGIALAGLGRASEAEAEYRESIRLDPGMADAYRNLGFLEWTQHLLPEAGASLRAALKLTLDDLYAHYYLGRVELEAKDYALAIAELERSRAAWPDEPEFLLDLAIGYAETHRETDASKILHRLQSMPFHGGPSTDGQITGAQAVRLGALLISTQDTDAALKVFRKLDQKRQAWTQFNLALAYLLTGHAQEAAAQAHSIVGAPPSSPPADELSVSVKTATVLGIAYARLAEHEKAVEAFYRAAELAPQQEERWLDLTRELMELRKFDDAITAVQRGIDNNPQSYVLRLRSGAAYMRSGRYAEAEAVFRDLIARGEPVVTSYIGLCQVLLRNGKAEEAARELAAAREKLGTSFLLAYFQGIALERAARPQESLAAFEEAVRLNPQSVEAHLGLGRVELHEKQIKRAILELNEVLRLDSRNRQARPLLSQAYRLAGDSKLAQQYAQSREEVTPPASDGELIGDFFVPGWEWPSGETEGNTRKADRLKP